MRFNFSYKKNTWIRLAILGTIAVVLIVLAATRKPKPPEIDEVKGNIPTVQQVSGILRINVYSHDQNKMVLMNMDDYVVGCLAAEMPASFEMEALKAQAVAIRTLAYRAMGQKSACHGADVCDDSTHCQGYASVDERKGMWGSSFEKWQQRLEEAVYDTNNIIITYEDRPIEVFYHASSDGLTEDSIHVFSAQQPYLVAVSSPDEGISTETKVYTAYSFTQLINAAFKSAKLKENELMDQVVIRTRYASGRVESIKLGGAIVTGVDVRRALNLQSADFSIVISGDQVTVTTKGFGHGVGMSQRGANAMAKNGAKFGDILVHYFQGVELSKIKG